MIVQEITKFQLQSILEIGYHGLIYLIVIQSFCLPWLPLYNVMVPHAAIGAQSLSDGGLVGRSIYVQRTQATISLLF